MEAVAGRARERTERFNPFPGLRPFEPDEDHLFFGRERETDELLRRLRGNRFLSVLGTSGSGKSSLVRSGLIPSLYSGFMVKAGSDWRVAILRPGEDPIGNLASALDAPEVLGGDEQMGGTGRMLLETSLRRSSLGLADCARHSHMAPQENLLVVVDQFEELFRFRESRREHGSRDEAIAFAKLLLGAANQEEMPVYIVLTMRSDFIGDCMEYPGLPEAINEGQYLIPRMTREELRHAITGPVAVGGGEIAPRLVTRLLNEVGDDPDQLPVLQHALMRSWDHWDAARADGEPLDLGHYEGIGTMSEALSRHAEEAYGELDDAGVVIAERLFKALTDKRKDERGVRRPSAVDEVAAVAGVSADEVIQVVEVFRKPGRSFLMPPAGVELGPESIIDLSHESLMRGWSRLAEWVDDETQSGKEFRRLSRAAQRYGGGQASLWADPELSLGLQWRAESGSNAAWAKRYDRSYEEALKFLDESKAANDARVEAAERERRAKLRRARILAAVLGSAAVIMLILGALALRASAAAKVAQLQAVKEAETAEAVSGFLVDLFEVVDPEEAQGDTITAREILDQGAAKIDSQLAGQPEVQAQLMGTIGKVYGSLGLYDEAAPLLDRSLESSTELLGADDPATLTAMHRRAEVHQEQGHFREAQELFEAALEGRRRVLGEEDAATLESQVALAEVANEQGRYQESADAIRSAMEIQSRVLGAQHRDTLRSLSLLADAEGDLGHYPESEELGRRAWEGQIAVLGEEHPETLASMSELASLYTTLGRYAEAERLRVNNLEARRRVLGDEHPKTLTAEAALAQLDEKRGRWPQAEKRMRAVLEARQRVLGDEHPSTLDAARALAWNLRLQSRPEDAEDLVAPALEVAERTQGEDHPITFGVRNVLAATLNNQGRGPEAELLYQKNLDIALEKFGEAHQSTLTSRNNLAVAYSGRLEKVEELFQKNYDIALEAWGEEHPTTLFYLNNLTSQTEHQGRLDEAESMALRSVGLHRKVLGDDHPQTLWALDQLRSVRVDQKRFEEAEALIQEVLEGRRRVFGEDHPQTVNSYITMAVMHRSQGRHDEAEKLFQKILEARTRLLGEEHPETVWVYDPLSEIAVEKGEFDRVLAYQKKVLAILRRVAFRPGARVRQKRDYAQLLTDAALELQNPGEALQIMLEVNETTDYADRNHRMLLAECHFLAGDPETAIKLVEETRPMVPADQIGFLNWIDTRIAKYQAAMGDDGQRREAAMENLARVQKEAEADGASPRSRNGYAWALVSSEFPDLHRPAEAIRIAEEVNADTGRERPHMLNTLAVAYLLDGQKQKALATLNDAIALIPAEDNSLQSYQWRREAFEFSDREQDFDLLAVLSGKWLFLLPGVPMRVNVEWVHEGNYVQLYVLDDIPFLPKDTALFRVHLETRQAENLHNEDPSWTVTRWKPWELRPTDSGDILLWGEDWNAMRNTRP